MKISSSVEVVHAEGEKMRDMFILIFSPSACITDLAGGDFHSCCVSCWHNSVAQQSLGKIRDYM